MHKRFVPIAVVAVIAVVLVLAASALKGGFMSTSADANTPDRANAANPASFATSGQVSEGQGARPEVGEQAPEFSATDWEGNEVALADYKGAPTWLVFNASWCAACRAEAPDVQAVHEKVGSNANVVAIYLNEDLGKVATFAGRLGLTYPHIPDPDGAVSAQFHVIAIPHHVFLDANGTITGIHAGGITEAQALAKLSEAGLNLPE
ncbi:Peroxiredoxin [Bowdeniella nasicola]|uniref:Peroxiredoxin n=1 Tax=Bowdeniella nasicola TaxID=208480 RepID=A0A1H3WYZ6_9ACTO|nr:TlpA disulfide reductase family protein [Bowdeniella nasicola]SDZ91971.1 Peroxiredoxin [Bowdeniella nasicola]